MIAITRHVAAGLLAGLDQARAFRELLPDAVDLDVEHLRLRLVRHEFGSQETRNLKRNLAVGLRVILEADSFHD